MPIRAENREKVKVIVGAACAVFAVLLVISLIVGLVGLSSASTRKNKLERELSELNTQIELRTADVAYYQSSEYIEMMAREYLNMKGKDEITFVGK